MATLISVKDLLEFPPPKRIEWKKWSEDLDEKDKKVLDLFRKQIKKELRKYNIETEIFVQPVPVSDAPWGDFSSSILSEKYENYDDKDVPDYIIFEPKVILKDENTKNESYVGFYPILRKKLYLQHHLKSDSAKEIALKVLSQYFEIEWNKSDQKSIRIIDLL